MLKKYPGKPSSYSNKSFNLGNCCAAASLLQEIISWCETGFTALSKTDKARKLVMVFVSRLQGISLLTLTFKNRNYTNQQTEYLVNWLEALAKGVK